MCGICGMVGFQGLSAPAQARASVEAMVRTLAHRGPNDAGVAATNDAVLGATRLAIRGLSDGTQPIIDSATGVVVVCNGEIDNHRELREWLAQRGPPVKQATDVAVIPRLYLELGDDFVSRLRGVFALAVWDPRQRRLLLARDRAGERPLFYALTPDGILFATEIAPIIAHARLPVTPDPDALANYLRFGVFPSPAAPFRELHKIAAGEMMVFAGGSAAPRRYWRWRSRPVPKQTPTLDALDDCFRDAVRHQSDVEVDFGVFLSGGIDSSLVSAVLRSLHPHRAIRAFTLRFREPSFDEGDFAQTVADHLKLTLTPVWVGAEEIRTEISRLVGLVGEPLADPAWAPTALLSGHASREVRMALVGEGADELFGGYPTYLGAGLAERYTRLPAALRAAFRSVVERFPPSDKKVTLSYLLKRFVQAEGLDGIERHQLWVSNLSPAILTRLGVAPPAVRTPPPPAGTLLDRVQQWDLETSLAEGLLTKADRASMSYGLELRAPFLDQRVLEFAEALPDADRVRRFETKAFLKQYATRYLPRSVVYRRKRGLSVPLARWLRGPLHDWAVATLGNGRLAQVGIQETVALELLSEHLRREADHARALWTLLVLSLWLDWAAGLSNRPAAD